MLKSVQYPIQMHLDDERTEVPLKCQTCIWRTGRVCALPQCVKVDKETGRIQAL